MQKVNILRINQKVIKFSVHIAIWILLLISTINFLLIEYSLVDAVIFSTIYVFSLSVIFYLNYLFIANLLFIHKKYFLYLLVISATIFLINYLTMLTLLSDWFASNGVYNVQLDSIINLILLCGVSSLLRGYEFWYDAREKQIKLEKENIAKELQFLKSQINPHFLFNTLNNIYSLTYHKDDKAPEMISKLSKLLRYMLYDCSNNRVELKKEIEMIGVYLDLEILRLGEDRNIDFYHEGVNSEYKIAPLILINVIENAFKHSDISNNRNGWIKIELLVNGNKLNYSVENTMNLEKDNKSKSGIGLENLQKQLDINYNEKSTLNITRNKDRFKIEIEIELDENNEV